MNIYSKLFAGFAAMGLMASCSNDIDEPNNGGGNPVGSGELAYMKVSINPVDTRADATRAGEDGGETTDNPDYKDGTEYEHLVKNAYFYFFNEDGTLVSEGHVYDVKWGEDNPENDNFEWETKNDNIIVLENLTEKEVKNKYMLTVLNKPASFKPTVEMSVDDVLKGLQSATKIYSATLSSTSEENGTTTTYSKPESFIMSTASYLHGTNTPYRHVDYESAEKGGAPRYFFTELDNNDVCSTESEARNQKPVEVYVERLAAKVQFSVAIGNDASTGATLNEVKEIDGVKYYRINTTVAGEANSGSTAANMPLYVRIDGWELNSTAKESYLSKQFDDSWKTTDPFRMWNTNDYKRSFWAMSPYYKDFGSSELADDNIYFEYKKYNEIFDKGNVLKASSADHTDNTAGRTDEYTAYCYENTSKPEWFTNGSNLLLDRLTNVLVKAQVVTIVQKEGKDVVKNISMINHFGLYYTEEHFKKVILSDIYNSNAANYYWYMGEDADGKDTYEQVSAAELSYEELDSYDGSKNCKLVAKVNPEAKADKNSGNVELYKITGKNDNGNVYEVVNDGLAKFNAAIATQVGNNGGVERFNNGYSYYSIPIEHNGVSRVEDSSKEAYYGVVRNHWYQVEVNSIKKVGHGVFDPKSDKVIKPVETPKQYFVGAKIRVLSWRLVKQNVNL